MALISIYHIKNMSIFELGNLTGSQNFSGAVDSIDSFDIYKFSLSGTGSLKLSLGGLTNNADLQLLNSNGDVLYNSSASGVSPEEISLDNFILGVDYFARVGQVTGDTKYNLTLELIEKAQESNPSIQVDPITGSKIESDSLSGGQNKEFPLESGKDIIDTLTNPAASQSETLTVNAPQVQTIVSSTEFSETVNNVSNDLGEARSNLPVDSSINEQDTALETIPDIVVNTSSNDTNQEAIASPNPTTTANPVELDADGNNSSETGAIASPNPTTTANPVEIIADGNNSSETGAIASDNPTTTANPLDVIADGNNSSETGAIASDNDSTSPEIIDLINPQTPSFDFGKFVVDATGIVGIDYLFDGGWFEGELGIFSLTGMEQLIPHSDEFITEAARRAASNSELGYVVINDVTEGARFSGGFPFDNNLNKGSYLGVKTFNMQPGDTFAIILIPNGATMQQVADKSVTGNQVRPLFSLPIANPNGTFATGQIADVTGEGNTFVMEDIGQEQPYSDKDFNDIIFQVRGAIGSAVSIDSVINPAKEWRTSNMGQALIEYAKAYVTPIELIVEDPTEEIPPDIIFPDIPGIEEEVPIEDYLPDIIFPDIPGIEEEVPIEDYLPDIIFPDIPGIEEEVPTQAIAPEIIKSDIPVVVENPPIAIAPEIIKPDIPVVVENPPIAIAPEIIKPDIPVVTVETPTIAIAPEIIKPDIPVVTVETPTIAIAPEITKPDIPVITVESPTIAIAPEIIKPDIPVITVESPTIAIAPEITKPDISVVTVETPNNAIAPDTIKPNIPAVVETPNNAIAPAPDTTKPNVPVANTTTVPPVVAAPPVQGSVTQPIASTPAVSFNFPKADQPLVGTINTGFNANNPDIDYARIILGQDRVDGDANPLLAVSKGDDSGTATLGIIGATQDNKIGINGVNDDAPLWVGRAGVNSDQWAQSLMEFVDAAKASQQPNAIINLGFNLTQTNPDGTVTPRYELTAAERAALAYAQRHNVIIVASAGDNPGQMSALGKASLEYDNIITVGAAERVNNSVALSKAFGLANYSGSGAGLDILAEGGTAEKPITVTSAKGTGNAFGTSVATATVTGAISQVWAANPKLNYTQVIDILKRTATDLGKPNWDMQTGAGLLNITAAVNLAKITTPELYTVKPGQQTITDNFISQNNPSKQLPGDPTHPAATPPGIPRTSVDQGANNLSGTQIRISATQDVIDQVSSIDPTDVYRGTSRELAGAKFKLLTGQAIVSVMSPSGQVLSRQVLSRGTHNLQMPANAPAEVLLKIDTNGTDATYVLQGFEAERNEPFDINLEFESPLTASQRQIMQAAAKSVASLIGKGLPSAVVDGKIIDDINIKIAATNLDGVSGTQARTKIDFMRYGTLLPAQAITQFDAADLATLERSGQLFSVAQHEFLHALGFGNLWEAKGLVDYAGTPLAQYNGKQGVDAFKELGGLTDFISLETEGKGSAGFHWNEALFQNEVMTADLGFKTGADGGVFSPISGVTIASLADLGYEVNLNRATPDFGLFGGARFNPADLTPEQIEAFQQLALASAANQAGEFIPAIMPQVDPNKVAPEIWAHAEKFWKNGEYYDWQRYQIQPGDTLSALALRYLGNAGYDYYKWIGDHKNQVKNYDYIVAWEWIEVPIHRPNYEQEQEAERRRREEELRQRQEEEERRRREQEEQFRRDEERRRQEEEARRREAEARQRELEEQQRRLQEEMERRRQEEERRKEEERLRELARQAEIARQQGKGGLDWYVAKPLPEFGPVDPFETSLTGETVGNLVPDDYYRFTLSRNGRITAELRKLLADADLVLYDVRNEPIAYSMREGITDEEIVADLIPGTYLLRVNSPKGVTTDYELIVKFKHKLSQTEIGPPPGWRVGGSNGNGGNGGGGGNIAPGATFADPRIERIYKQAIEEFAAPLRRTLNQQVADLKSKRDKIERQQKALIASMSAELRQKVHTNLDKVRDEKRSDIDKIANGIKGDIDWLVDGTWKNIKNLIPGAVRDFGPIKSGLDGIWQAIDGRKKWLQGKIDWVKDRIKDAIWWFIQKLKDAYITGGEANIKIEEFAKEFRNKIDDQLTDLNDLIDDFRSEVLSKVNFTKSIGVDWKIPRIKFNLYDAISGTVNDLTNGAKGLIKNVGGFFKDRTSDVEYLVQQTIGAIASLMGDETGRIYNKMRADMQEIDNQINSLTGKTENTIRAKASQYKFDLEQMLINLGGEGKKILNLILDFGNSPVGQLGILAIEVLLGLVPGIGQAIDIKDTYVALDNIYVKGQKNVWEYINLLLALSGWVPGLGDLIKSVGKAALKGGGALVGILAKLGADTVESIIKAIRNTDWNKIAKNLFDTLGNKWDDMAGKIAGAPSWVFGKLRQGFDNVRKGVSQTIDNFKKSPVGQWLNEAVEELVERVNKAKTAARLRNELGDRLFNDLTNDLTFPGLELLVNRLTSQGVKDLNNNLLRNSGMTIKQAAIAFQRRAVGTPSLPSNLHGYGNANMSHFLDEHTFEFLDFAKVRPSGPQSMWPPGTDVAQMLEEALSLAPHPTVAPGSPIQRTLSNGITVQIGSRLRSGSVEIGQFFPISGTGVVTFNKMETDALMDIKNLLGI